MLTFLRKIRLRLLGLAPSGKEGELLIESRPAKISGNQGGRSARKPASPAGRYIFYAFGEIALVVIGILIALQINNWNESQKNLNLEQEFVSNIKSDLLEDVSNFEHVISIANEKLTTFETLLEEMPYLYQFDQAKMDSLFISAFDPISTFFPVDGTFKSESSSGNMGIFRDKEFISNLYNLYREYERLRGNSDNLDNTWTIRYEKYKRARRTGSLGKLNEEGMEDVQDDLSRSYKHLKFYVERCEFALDEVNKILQMQ